MSTETIQKGWLYTREGEKFAPCTLVENVTTRSGKSYDEHVRGYLSNLNTSLTQKINNIKTEVESSGKDYDDAIAALQSKDATHDSNISVLQTKTITHDTEITSLKNKLQYFDGNSSDKFFIIDNNENVVAYIDHEGVHATSFQGKDDETAFYLVDNSDAADPQVAVRMDETGVYAIDFQAKDQTYTLVGLNTKVGELIELIDANKRAYDKLEENLIEYYGYNEFEQDAFYFIDNTADKNVGTMINATGVVTTNITFANHKNAKDNMMFFERLGTINITI